MKHAAARGAVLVDVRGEKGWGMEDTKDWSVDRALNLPWNSKNKEMSLEGLPDNKDVAIIVYCARGTRAEEARQFLLSRGYTNVLNGGGPCFPGLWAAYSQ